MLSRYCGVPFSKSDLRTVTRPKPSEGVACCANTSRDGPNGELIVPATEGMGASWPNRAGPHVRGRATVAPASTRTVTRLANLGSASAGLHGARQARAIHNRKAYLHRMCRRIHLLNNGATRGLLKEDSRPRHWPMNDASRKRTHALRAAKRVPAPFPGAVLPRRQHIDACRWTLLPRSGAPNGLIHIRCCRPWFYRAGAVWLFSQNHEIRYGLLY